MPVMSRFERAYCCSAVGRSSSSAIARELCAQRLGRDVLEIGAAISLRSRLLGHVMQFFAHKSKEEI
jgi:hypothetical protein